jgi:hypothetical protein
MTITMVAQASSMLSMAQVFRYLPGSTTHPTVSAQEFEASRVQADDLRILE